MGFLQYIDFIFAPFRAIQNKIVGVKNVKGNFQVDVNRSKALVGRVKSGVGDANAAVNKFAGGGQQQQAQQGAPQQGAQQYYGGQPMQQGQPGMPGMPGMPQQPGMPGMPGMPGAPGAPGAPSAAPPIRTTGWWIFKKKFCTQCQQQLDKTWDSCPYCAQMAQQAAAAPAKLQKMKTQALVLDAAGQAGSMQLCGWIVPLQGPHRGELYTLQPTSTFGNDPSKCTFCMQDKFMSGKHAEIKAENGLWILKDAGSTNGTYVNNRRIDRHELVDNDFIKFGSALCKFKSL